MTNPSLNITGNTTPGRVRYACGPGPNSTELQTVHEVTGLRAFEEPQTGLSFRALIYIMKHFPHLITDVSEDTILDRAQSNCISKALLIVQVGWFCANCASRLIQHLPLSLLEVSTAAHALCTLLTYVVWWSKPLNIPEPIKHLCRAPGVG